MKQLLAEVNISEGRDISLINAVKEALMCDNDVDLIDLNSDADHNRTVFTYLGEPKAVLAGTKRLCAKSVELIDMTKHTGSHPRMGAVDVVPFIPVKNVTTEEAVAIAKEFGQYLSSLGVPVYFYEDAAVKPERKSLVDVRRGQYEALEEKFKDEAWLPDAGPFTFNPKSGATVTGARFPLVAFNVNLATEDIEVGRKIVKAVRAATGGYQAVRAMALPLPAKKQVQISMNLLHYEKSPIHRVFETIKSELTRYNVSVADTELVGPVPLTALEEVLKFYLKLGDNFSLEQIYGGR